ncbi:DUF4376 domain-containing protein [Neisseria polysaccharea]|uniref:DUF4376 domain-containing protein n=1 Tax=Neisseria polysaccharea TaxID=489 RepID=UPI0027DF8BF3|nr:DUF4376 domain-containing protein [Neisseria polysaccharea]
MTTGLDGLNRSDIKITDDSPETVLAATIADYESRTGKKLQPAHIERLLINTYAYRETLLRQQINEAYRQQHVRYATGLMLDLCGDDVNTPRLQASAARCSIPALKKWLQSDEPSRTQYLQLQLLEAKGLFKQPVRWKTMDNSFIGLDATAVTAIALQIMDNEQADFANAERHRAAMLKADNPLDYDYSGGWTANYATATER